MEPGIYLVEEKNHGDMSARKVLIEILPVYASSDDGLGQYPGVWRFLDESGAHDLGLYGSLPSQFTIIGPCFTN